MRARWIPFAGGVILIILAISIAPVGGCEREGDEGVGERAGRELDKAGEKLGEAIEDLGEGIQDATRGKDDGPPLVTPPRR